MKFGKKFNYRHAKEILKQVDKGVYSSIRSIVGNGKYPIDLRMSGPRRTLSRQIQEYFRLHGWVAEHSCFSAPEMKYDLLNKNIPIEIELGHQRLVYADFFKFLADYTKQKIALGIILAADDPNDFGHDWHNSVESTKRKIMMISETFPVPVWVIGVKP